ncbi:hypothetical protein HN358_03155 [Candidatus Uhrbacteria bacterium]|nr:hypothetical protein [Candidatus Uhrbacteria bacterium]MBT7717197.1 hypothetical protein [Candidatus Uhrbacteria bacterium]
MLVSEITARFASHPAYPVENVEVLRDIELVFGGCSSKDNRNHEAEILSLLENLETGTTALVMPGCCNQYSSEILAAIKANCPKGIELILPARTPDLCDNLFAHIVMPWLENMGMIRIKEDLFPW